MKRSISIVCIFFLTMLAVPLVAQQNDTIRQEILNQGASDLEIISKGRSLTLEHLMKGDLVALKEVKDYLAGEIYNPYRVYTPVEYWLLSFWTEDFRELLHEAKQFAAEVDWGRHGHWQMPERFRPTPLLRMIMESDRLSEEVAIKSAEAYVPLEVSINNAELEEVEKEFLKLWLYSLLFTPDEVDDEPAMAEINTKATEFLETYAGNDYSDYTRRFIRYRFRPGDWGIGYEFFLGYNVFTGGLSNHFENRVAGGFAYDILYKEFTVSLRLNISSTKTTREVVHRGVAWPEGIRGYVVGGDIALQYPAYQSRNMKLSPFIGIGGVGMGPSEAEIKKYPELDDFKEFSAFNYLAGLDFKLNSWNKNINLSRDGGGYVGLRYTYYFPNYSRKNTLMDGNMHMVTLTFGGFGRPMKRDF